jgi:hypothetical protein
LVSRYLLDKRHQIAQVQVGDKLAAVSHVGRKPLADNCQSKCTSLTRDRGGPQEKLYAFVRNQSAREQEPRHLREAARCWRGELIVVDASIGD